MAKIIGLFEDDRNLECAVNGLYERGFTRDEIKIINPSHVSPEARDYLQDQQVGASARRRFAGSVAAAWPWATPIDPTGLLTKLGVPKAEACFYAVNVKRGNRLVIVQTYHERATEAQHILRQANARTSSGYE